jgi:hypothetical protein
MLKGIKRSAIRQDLKFFLLPWISISLLAPAVALWEYVKE